MSGAIPPFPNTPSWRGAQLTHGDNFTFTFISQQSAHCSYRIEISDTDIHMFSISDDFILTVTVSLTPPHPDRLWDPPSLLSNGYRSPFPWG
jgi:hypothetical protein